ncbi:hypothetical protein FSST1_007574 [Fusarium sambucinum]
MICISNMMVPGGLSCTACQLLPEGYSHKTFKHAHGFEDDWNAPVESDEERYRIPETRRDNAFNEYLELARRTRLFAVPEFINVMSWREKRTLLRNLKRIEQYYSLLSLTQERHRGRLIDDGTDYSYTTTSVRACVNIFEEVGVTIQVCRAMSVQNGRWYLGHCPGTYIFKYRGSQIAGSDSDSFMNARGYISNNFEYAGQIPRLEEMQKQRLGLLFPKMLRLFISELQVFAGLQHRETYPELEEMLLERVESATSFHRVWNHWRNANLNVTEWPDAEVQNCFVSHPRILELAWILNYLKRRHSGENQPPEPLELLIISATQKQLPELASLWEDREQAVAWNMLKSGRRTGLFVYEVTRETEDIHNFYSQAQFSDDPLNPAIAHSFIPLSSYQVSAEDYQVGVSEDPDAS